MTCFLRPKEAHLWVAVVLFAPIYRMGSYGDQWMQCTRCDWWGKCTGHVTEDCTLYVVDVDCATDKAPLLLCSWCIDDKMLPFGETKNKESVGEALRTPECSGATTVFASLRLTTEAVVTCLIETSSWYESSVRIFLTRTTKHDGMNGALIVECMGYVS